MPGDFQIRCPRSEFMNMFRLVTTGMLLALLAACSSSSTPTANLPRDASPPPSQAVQCANGVLPPGDGTRDLQVTGGECTVAAGTYLYRNVNVWGGGILTFTDAKIDFHAHSILVENGGTLQAGVDAPVTGPINIWLYGSVTDGIPSITCQSDALCGVPQGVWSSNTNMVAHMQPSAPCAPASNFDPSSPLGGDCFYQYDKLDDDDIDGAFFGRKVLALSYGGSIHLRGAKGIRSGAMDADPSDSGTSWVRLSASVSPGATALHLDRLVPTWSSGDHIVLTTTDYQPSHTEELVISSVTSDLTGTVVNLVSPVQYPHWGVAYDYSDLPAGMGRAMTPIGRKHRRRATWRTARSSPCSPATSWSPRRARLRCCPIAVPSISPPATTAVRR